MQTKENNPPQPSPERETLSPALREQIQDLVSASSLRWPQGLLDQVASLAKAEGYAEGRQAGAQEAWQPIETAPKGGESILLLVPWRPCAGAAIGSWLPISKQWCHSDRDDTQPTHWMPLPEPPRATSQDPQEPQR